MGRGITRRPAPAFSLGGLAAESDPLLHESFFVTRQYDALASKDSEKCFLIGRTGSGKSALLQLIEDEHEQHVIRVNPDSLALTYIAERVSSHAMAGEDVKLSAFFIALWKRVFLVEVLRHRYSISSPMARQNHLQALKDRIAQNRGKIAALEYLEEFGDRFWCETEERVREVVERLEEKIQMEASGGLAALGTSVKTGASSTGVRSTETRTEVASRVQKIVNETQTAKLNKMITVLDEDILDSPQHFTYLVIDDLDKVWVDNSLYKELVLCLFRAVIDLKKVRNLKIIVALRTNIFKELDFAGGIGGQAEKFWALTLPVRWTADELEELLDIRVQAAGHKYGRPDLSRVRDILPMPHKHKGPALEYILRRTMMRPRDVMAYLKECHDLSSGKPVLSWQVVQEAERLYSFYRLEALYDEWGPSYPGIDRIFEAFRGVSQVMSRDDLWDKLYDASLLLADTEFTGRGWLMDMLRLIWDPQGSPAAKGDLTPFRRLVVLLFETGFLGIRHGSPRGTFSHNHPDYLASGGVLDSAQGFLVHPVFWMTLEIGDQTHADLRDAERVSSRGF